MAADQLFGAWRTFFERIAEQGTVVLVFEDMHFADTGLLDFIDHLLDWSRGLPIYVVTLARPELIERRPDWGAGKRNFMSIYLEPLSEADMRELLGGPRARPARDGRRGDRRPRRRHPAVRGRDRAHARRRRPARRSSDGVYVPQRRPARTWPCRRRSRRSSPRASTRSTRPIGASSTTRPCSARASRWPRWRQSSA